MKGRKILSNIVYSSAFLAIIPAIVIMFFIPRLGAKYTLYTEPFDKNKLNLFYTDLDSDGNSEILHTGKGLPYDYLAVKNNDFRFYDQWNFKDSLDPAMSDFFVGNYDHNKYNEIYIFSYQNDSLFLNINEFFIPSGQKKERFYITQIRVLYKKVTSVVFPAGFYDVNNDGKDELYFSIMTGFGVEPRRLYYYDIANHSLKSSDITGVMIYDLNMTDADGDGRPEIFGSMNASWNNHTWAPFSDKSTWMMVFNDKLKFKFPPVEIPGFTNHIDILAYTKDDFKGYLLSHNTGAADTTVILPRLMLYGFNGIKIRERLYSDMGLRGAVTAEVIKINNADHIFLIGDRMLEVDDKFQIINKSKISFESDHTCYLVDMDFDGNKEIVVFSAKEGRLLVFNGKLERLCEAKIAPSYRTFRFSHYKSKKDGDKVFLADPGNGGYFLRLESNAFFYLAFLIYPSIYFLVFGFISLVKRINTIQIVQKETLKRRLVTLQLQGIKSQLDPHFTFNTLNSIASLIYLEDRHMAYDYMNKFTHLLRSLINDAERIYRSLDEELEFVTTYLELEKLRFGNKFNYEIILDEKITRQEQVPKLVLQTFAENAIKHGIMSYPDGGTIKIRAQLLNDYMILSIEDNGIGRVKSRGQSLSTGKGMKLTGEFYEILNQLNKKPIKYDVIDLHNENGEASGTRIEVWVPLS